MPRPDNAIFTLSKAMAKIADYDTQPKLIDSTREFFTTLEKTSKPPMSGWFHDLVNSTDPAKVHNADVEISKDPLLHAIMRNTIAPVFLKAGFRGNVIPGSAEATLNFRTIPGTNVDELVSEIKAVINDSRVDVTDRPWARAGSHRRGLTDRSCPPPILICIARWSSSHTPFSLASPSRRICFRRAQMLAHGAAATFRSTGSIRIQSVRRTSHECTATMSASASKA